MPKLLVLVDGGDENAVALARTAAHAAKHVRFTEVDVRGVNAVGGLPALEGADAVMMYDGILVATGSALSANAIALLERRAGDGASSNAVFAAVSDADAHGGLPNLGAIVVTARGTGKAQADALGTRIAKVIGWVRHALGHEAEHHADGHAHQHEHHKGHSHQDHTH